MQSNIQTVIGTDGSMHIEHTAGAMRQTLGQPGFKTVIPFGNGMSSVISQDGSMRTEFLDGTMRQTIGRPGFETII